MEIDISNTFISILKNLTYNIYIQTINKLLILHYIGHYYISSKYDSF